MDKSIKFWPSLEHWSLTFLGDETLWESDEMLDSFPRGEKHIIKYTYEFSYNFSRFMEPLKPACLNISGRRKLAYLLMVQFIFTSVHFHTWKCLLGAYFMAGTVLNSTRERPWPLGAYILGKKYTNHTNACAVVTFLYPWGVGGAELIWRL